MTRSQAATADSEQTIPCAKNVSTTSVDQVIADPPKKKSRRSSKDAKSIKSADKEPSTSTTTGKPRKKASKKATIEKGVDIAEEQVDAAPSKKTRGRSKKQIASESVTEEETGSTVAKATRKKSTKKKATDATEEIAEESPKRTRKKSSKKSANDHPAESTQPESTECAVEVAPTVATKQTRRKSTKKAVAEVADEDPQPEIPKDEAAVDVDPKTAPKKTRKKSTKKATIEAADTHASEGTQLAATSTEAIEETAPAAPSKKARGKPAKVAATEAIDPPKPKKKSSRKTKTDKSSGNMKTLDAYFFVLPKKADAKSATEECASQSEPHQPVHTSQISLPVEPADTRPVDQQTADTESQQTLDDPPPSQTSEGKVDDIYAQTLDGSTADTFVQQSVAAQSLHQNLPSDSLQQSVEPSVARVPCNVVAPPPQRQPIPQVLSSPPMWVDKHSPSHISMVAGNRGVISQLEVWLKDWQKNVDASEKGSAKKRGRTACDYRAVLLSGPPGVGKTSAAHLVARNNGYRVIEHNASDVRSRKLIQDKISHMVDNRTMTEFYQSYAFQDMQFVRSKALLIMDEVDGMSVGDYGGIQELLTLIRVTKIPIICICNDIQSKKVQSLKTVCLSLRFLSKFTVKEAQSAVKMVTHIGKKENLHINESALKSVMIASHYDIRNTINTLQMHRLLSDKLEHEEAQSIIENQRKDREMNIFEIVNVLFSDNTWEHKSLEQIADLCYQEQHLTPEMVFENYLKFEPTKAAKVENVKPAGKEMDMRLKLAAEAAESMADGDLMESTMYSSHRHMNDPLLPAARYMAGSVRPAALLRGKSPGFRLGFPASLGKGSTAMKFARQLTELRDTMRLRTYATRHEIRREYVPILNDRISSALVEERYGDTIDLLNAYYLSRKSIDILSDLYLSPEPGSKPMDRVSGSVKASLTRRYKKISHPISIAPKDGTDIIKKKTTVYRTDDLDEEPVPDDLFEEDDVYHYGAI